jgi:hypothetical protein
MSAMMTNDVFPRTSLNRGQLRMDKNRRMSLRHPGGLTVRFQLPSEGQECFGELKDLGLGGLGLYCCEPLVPGLALEVSIVKLGGSISYPATVLWCQGRAPLFEAGVRFARSVDPFRARMLEQICYIEAYRRRIYKLTGRAPSADGAALEWIRKFASRFPRA